jgi:hypothetical protein
LAKDDDEAEEVCAAIRKFIAPPGELTNARYYAIFYEQNGKEMRARVGDPDPLTGEPVVAILKSSRENGPFYICTPSHGVACGSPILVSSDARAFQFEERTGRRSRDRRITGKRVG